MKTGSKKMGHSIKEAIVATIAYFDMFDFPLTMMEIRQFMLRGRGLGAQFPSVLESPTPEQVVDALDSDDLRKIVGSRRGFYFLKDRESVIETRLRRYNIADRKYKRALRAARVYKMIPWISMIAVANIIGAHNTREESDIDLFIVTEKNRIWITRLFAVIITKLLGWRASDLEKKDKICLSFFVSEEKLKLQDLNMDSQVSANENDPYSQIDVYFIYWVASLNIIYSPDDDIVDRFWRANEWVRDYLPDWSPSAMPVRRNAGRAWSGFYHDTIDIFWGGLDYQARRFQMKYMAPQLKNIMNMDTRVVMNDQVLKMHAGEDKRKVYYNRWRHIVANYELWKIE